MEAAKTVDDIEILEYPLEVNYGQWAIDHPECDTIYEQIGTGSTILVYAFALSKKANSLLVKYRDKHLQDKKILMGVSLDGIRSII